MRPDSADTALRFDAWAARFELTDTLARLRGVVLPWVANCAPEGASADDHALAAADLAMFIFYLDDIDEEEESRRFAEVERVLAGEHLGPEASPLQRGWSDLVERVAARGLPMARFISDRQAVLAAWRERNDARRRARIWSLEDWISLRSTTIFMRQWMSLWELVSTGVVSDQARAHPAFERAVRATCRWQVLYNEVASIARDRASGETNAVLLVMRDRRLDERDAATHVLRTAKDERDEFERAARELAVGDDGVLRAYVDALRMSIEGAVAHYADRHARYERVPSG